VDSRIGSNWQSWAGADRLLVLDVASDWLVERDLMAQPSITRLYRNAELAVLERDAAPGFDARVVRRQPTGTRRSFAYGIPVAGSVYTAR
jgi:hypothetical protein